MGARSKRENPSIHLQFPVASKCPLHSWHAGHAPGGLPPFSYVFLRSMIRLFLPWWVLHCIRACLPRGKARCSRGGLERRTRPRPIGSQIASLDRPPNGVARQCPNCSGVAHHGAQEKKGHLTACGRSLFSRPARGARTNWPQTPRAPGNQPASVFRISARALCYSLVNGEERGREYNTAVPTPLLTDKHRNGIDLGAVPFTQIWNRQG